MASTITLYRAAPIENPHFGLASYWTRSERFAHCFSQWLRETLGGRHVIYCAEVEMSSVLELRTPTASDIVTACVPLFASEGHRWVSFLDRGSAEGLTPEFARLVTEHRQYVYLGNCPITARPC